MTTFSEGDVVRILSGPSQGTLGKVVGYSLGTQMQVVQYPSGGLYLREEIATKDLGLVRAEREPLPPFPMALVDSLQGDGVSCGSMLSFPVKEGGMVTFVSLRGSNLKHVYETLGKRALLQESFATRLPHLVHLANGALIETLLLADSKMSEMVDLLVEER